MTIGIIEQEYSFKSAEFLRLERIVKSNLDYFKSRYTILEEIEKNDPRLFEDMTSYWDETLHNTDRVRKVIYALLEVERKLDPGISENDALDNICSVRINKGRV